MTIDLSVVGGFVLGAITFAGLIMAFARTPPEDAKSNLSKWITTAGIDRVPAALKSRKADYLGAVISLVAAIAGGAVSLAPKLYFTPAPQSAVTTETTPPKPDETNRPSLLFGLTDARRWQLSSQLRKTIEDTEGPMRCEAKLFVRPSAPSATQAADEAIPLMQGAGWTVQTDNSPPRLWMRGITIIIPRGLPAYACGERLQQMFQDLNVRYVETITNYVVDSQTCKTCLEIRIGDVELGRDR